MGLKLMCVWGGSTDIRISGTFLEHRNSFARHPVTDCAGHLDYTKANLSMYTHSFHPGFQFQKRYYDQWVSQGSCA